MLKLSLVISGVMLASAMSFANDTGMPAITVSDIKVSSVKGFGDQAVKTPIKKDAQIVAEFTGKDAVKLMQILPSVNYVSGDESYRKNNKSLDIVGKKQGSVSIVCRGGEASTSADFSKSSVPTPYKSGPKCTITIANSATGDGAFEQYQEFQPAPECKQ